MSRRTDQEIRTSARTTPRYSSWGRCTTSSPLPVTEPHTHINPQRSHRCKRSITEAQPRRVRVRVRARVRPSPGRICDRRVSGLAPPRQNSEAATRLQTPTSGFNAGSESLPCVAAAPMMRRPSRGRRSLRACPGSGSVAVAANNAAIAKEVSVYEPAPIRSRRS
jgi:hypothetical protein